MTRKVKAPVTKPASSLCNGQVGRAARVAWGTNMARIKKVIDVVVKVAKEEGK